MEQRATMARRHYRTAVAAFVIGLALGLTVRQLVGTAYAQVMDPGQQRIETNQGIAQLNAKMAEMLAVLRTGTLKVRLVETDKTSWSAPSAPSETGSPRSSPGTNVPLAAPGTGESTR